MKVCEMKVWVLEMKVCVGRIANSLECEPLLFDPGVGRLLDIGTIGISRLASGVRHVTHTGRPGGPGEIVNAEFEQRSHRLHYRVPI